MWSVANVSPTNLAAPLGDPMNTLRSRNAAITGTRPKTMIE
jgi:hypothetical protein